MDMFLDNSEFKKPVFPIKYIKNGKTPLNPAPVIQIYEDDTVKEVLIKLAIESKNGVTSEGIFAWFQIANKPKPAKIIPLGFNYPGIIMDTPFKNKNVDPKFIDEYGNHIVVPQETTLYKIMEHFGQTTIYYTTIVDYLRYLGLNPKKKITDEECKKNTSYECSKLFNGKIKKYWPRLKNKKEVFHFNHPPLVKHRNNKIKSEKTINERNQIQTSLVYKTKNTMFAHDFRTNVCSVTNSDVDNNVYFTRLFSDIPLTRSIPFSKIVMEGYNDMYCKLLKEVICYTRVDKSKFVTGTRFKNWSSGQVISIPATPLKYIDDRNSLTFKLYKQEYYVSVIIYSNGTVMVLFNDITKDVFTKSFIKDMIKMVNRFLRDLNKKKVYSEEPIKIIKTNYTLSFDFMTSNLVYPVKNYQIKPFITLLKNLSAFVRFNKTEGTMISCIYKRVNDYDNIDSKLRVISQLHNSKRQLDKEQIIKELETNFNISEEEAKEEYEQWYQLSNGGKVFQQGESGVEFII